MANNVQIVDYTPAYAADFRAINEEWIQHFFVMEPADYQALDHPQTYILDRGGYIFVALLEGQAVGVVAMIKMKNDSYELAKMGVRPTAQGHGIGYLLGQAVITKARSLGAKRLFLDSNTQLTAALQLYYKLGFTKLDTQLPTPYTRADIQLELWL